MLNINIQHFVGPHLLGSSTSCCWPWMWCVRKESLFALDTFYFSRLFYIRLHMQNNEPFPPPCHCLLPLPIQYIIQMDGNKFLVVGRPVTGIILRVLSARINKCNNNTKFAAAAWVKELWGQTGYLQSAWECVTKSLYCAILLTYAEGKYLPYTMNMN